MKYRPKCAVGISAAFVTTQRCDRFRKNTTPTVRYGGTSSRCAVHHDHHHHNDDDNDRNSIVPNVTTPMEMITNNKINDIIDDTTTGFDWDTFLDTPFFDPDRILQDPMSDERWKRFAAWVQGDYETVEVIVTATLFVFLIVVTQELLRIQIYGLEHYVPFGQGSRPGSLF